MLFFNTTNIFNYQNELNDKYIGFLGSDKSLLPFQIVIPKDTLFDSLTKVELINSSRTFEITDILTDFEVKQDSDNYYIIYKKSFPLATLPCGIWQLKVTIIVNNLEIEPPAVTRYYYSNFFTIIPDTSIIGTLQYSNTFDFDDKIYQTTYKNVLNFVNKTLIVAPFYKEIATERADGSKVYEYQSYSENYSIVIFGDIWTVKEIQKIKFFNIQVVNIASLGIVNENISLRTEVAQTFEDNRYYKITLIFSINQVEKNLCEANKVLANVEDMEIVEINNKVLLVGGKILQIKYKI